MPLTLTDVITPTLASEIEAEILSLCTTFELPVTSWQSGGVILTMIKIMSEIIAAKSLVEVEIAKGGLGDYTSPDWAHLWGDSIFDVQFNEAEAATGVVKLTNTENQIYNVDPGDLIVAHSVTGKTYRNQYAEEIPALGFNDYIIIQADEVGTESNAAPGEITTMVTTLNGVTVTNVDPVLGSDAELTPAYITRARSKLASLSPKGSKSAYDYVVQTPEFNPTFTRITRSRTVADPLTGEITVYGATAAGAPDAGDVIISQGAIDKWCEPWGIQAMFEAASEYVVDITYRVWIKSSLTDAQIKTEIATTLSEYLASVDVGGVVIDPDDGSLYHETLTHKIHNSVAGIEKVSITLPVSDIDLSPYQVPVIGTIIAVVTYL